MFSCGFYIEGNAKGNKFSINTYYPLYKKDDLISGTMEVITNKETKIKLPQEHGGCWNVQPFTSEPVEFELEKTQNWIQIRYVDTTKAFFYSDKADSKISKAYLLKGDIVCVEKIEKDWAYCSYIGKKTTTGWLKISELNKL